MVCITCKGHLLTIFQDEPKIEINPINPTNLLPPFRHKRLLEEAEAVRHCASQMYTGDPDQARIIISTSTNSVEAKLHYLLIFPWSYLVIETKLIVMRKFRFIENLLIVTYSAHQVVIMHL
jgi:hypothetical protein